MVLLQKESGHSKSRILREVETLKVCDRHPNIVQLIDVSHVFLHISRESLRNMDQY